MTQSPSSFGAAGVIGAHTFVQQAFDNARHNVVGANPPFSPSTGTGGGGSHGGGGGPGSSAGAAGAAGAAAGAGANGGTGNPGGQNNIGNTPGSLSSSGISDGRGTSTDLMPFPNLNGNVKPNGTGNRLGCTSKRCCPDQKNKK